MGFNNWTFSGARNDWKIGKLFHGCCLCPTVQEQLSSWVENSGHHSLRKVVIVYFSWAALEAMKIVSESSLFPITDVRHRYSSMTDARPHVGRVWGAAVLAVATHRHTHILTSQYHWRPRAAFARRPRDHTIIPCRSDEEEKRR